ncbi:MAG: hypothetical protein GTN53_39655 [Candidatus Aminicenantes bacterium]|nr:hypothetical protein [Candidatus Aminicenantes bacterium]
MNDSNVLEKRRVGRPRKKIDKTLTDSEIEVLKLLAEGKTVKQAAGLLQITTKNVDTHTARLMKKINVRNRVGLVKYALRENLIPLED